MASEPRTMPPMIPILVVGIESGRILWDDMNDSLGHVYDHACYDQQMQRRNKQSEITNLPITGTYKEPVVEFDKDTYCESCFCKTGQEVELRVKGKEIHCPSCDTRRPLRND